MTYIGKVSHGTVILPDDADLPDGTEVKVEPLTDRKQSNDLTRKLLSISRTVKGLPADLAKNHDHYLHGTPKR